MSRLISAAALALAIPAAAGAAKPPPANQETDWLRKPDADQMRAAFPVGLRGRGEAVIHCRVNTAGLLENCQVVSETPPGKGVGAAALLLTPNFQMRPALKDGRPVASAVNIPVRFSGGEYLAGAPRVQAILHPLWLQAPSVARMKAVYPKGAPDKGHVSMRCEVRADGALRRCEVLTEEPQFRGFGSAAKALAGDFRVYTDPARIKYDDVRVTLPLAFEAQPPEPRFLTAPDWSRKPDADQVVAVYPDKAVKDGVMTGRGFAECLVKADGSLEDCRAAGEEPAGEGFGEAAASLARYMAVAPWTQDGRPVDGAHIRIPFRFNYAHPEEAKGKAD